MAIILYTNGISEPYLPEDFTFTEEELVMMFDEYETIKTRRLIKVLNTWCIYGSNHIEDSEDLNKMASDLIDEPIYSPVLFVHDSELDPEWEVTDTILYKGYKEFVDSLIREFDKTVEQFMNEIEDKEDYDEKIGKLPLLSTLGTTPDKKVLFSYNPDDQAPNFYSNEEFYKFAQKVYEYISENKQKIEPFTIYEDKKAVIIIDTPKVNKFLNTILEKFKIAEEYETCTHLTKIIDEWDVIAKTSKEKIKKDDEEE